MIKQLATNNRRAGFKLVMLQASVALMITVITYIFSGSQAALSALVGGMTAVIPNLVFVIYAFRFVGASAAKQVTASFYRGESLKLLLTFVLFTLALKSSDIIPATLFLAFIATLITQWLAPIYFNNKN